MDSLMAEPSLSDIYEAEALTKRLKRSASPESLNLASILSQCEPRNPCFSGACIICGRRMQAACCELVDERLRSLAKQVRGRMTSYHLVPAYGMVDVGNLTHRSISAFSKKVFRLLSEAKVSPSAFCIDITLNDMPNTEFKPYWCIHVHGIAVDWPSAEQVYNLKQALTRSSEIKRPVRVEPLDERLEGVAYLFKPERSRRERSLCTPVFGHRGPYHDTHRRALRPQQSVELALAEHDYGLGQRIFTIGISSSSVQYYVGRFKRPPEGLNPFVVGV
ncbi:hypothetical protein [uncultured Methylobacterium sp.]|jgi:hypothetical protein|uniref:hypothetical protein n=1 Tax=uncultured Methylobacterium sp. TaxID=157278 RepID=UPI00261F3279|nr:hypothetical protein [uncultured Methylobacterium sp.]